MFRAYAADSTHPRAFPRHVPLRASACMQPCHAIDDGRFVEGRPGAERLRTSYAFRTLLDAGIHLSFGPD